MDGNEKGHGGAGSAHARRGGPSRQGRRIAVARKVTLALVFVAVLASLAFDSGIGTPSAWGIGEFFLLCPLGAIEAMVASKALIPVTLISLAVVAAFALLFGRAWCAWGCPAPVIRNFFRRAPKPGRVQGAGAAGCAGAAAGGGVPGGEACAGSARAGVRRTVRDPRTWVLVAVVAVTFVAGLPLFCLVCPVGLTFGTVGSLWHLVVDKQMTLSAVVFPAALAVELVLYRKWCASLCPIAALLNLFGHGARLFRPRVNAATCVRYRHGTACDACAAACPEHIDLHAPDAATALAECTRCGACVHRCPTASVSIGLAPAAPLDCGKASGRR